jgi:predicted transposase YbfD/YdcC
VRKLSYNVAFLDVCLDEENKKNNEGVDVAIYIANNYPHMAIFGISRVEFYDLSSLEVLLIPDSNGKSVAYSFIKKAEHPMFPDYINRAYVNSLKFRWGYPVNFSDLSSIESKKDLIQLDNEVCVPYWKLEFEELIRKVSFREIDQEECIEVKIMGKGRSRTVVLNIDVKYKNKNHILSYIVKIANKLSIDGEVENYINNVEGFFPSNSYPFLVGSYRSKNYYALGYKKIGDSIGDTKTFSDILSVKNIDEVIIYIRKIFWDVLSCRDFVKVSDNSIDEEYFIVSGSERFPSLSNNRWSDLWSVLTTSKKSQYDQTSLASKIKFKAGNICVNNPMYRLSNLEHFSSECQLSLVHGDLHGDNILIDNGNIALIDFTSTRERHALMDYVVLEMSIRVTIVRNLFKHYGDYPKKVFNVFVEHDLLLNRIFQVSQFKEETITNELKDSPVNDLFVLIAEIRTMAYAVSGSDFWNNYYEALFYTSMGMYNIRFGTNDIVMKSILVSTASFCQYILENSLHKNISNSVIENYPHYRARYLYRRFSDEFCKTVGVTSLSDFVLDVKDEDINDICSWFDHVCDSNKVFNELISLLCDEFTILKGNCAERLFFLYPIIIFSIDNNILSKKYCDSDVFEHYRKFYIDIRKELRR